MIKMSEEENKAGKKPNRFAEVGEEKQAGMVSEFIGFIKENKKFWMVPILIILFLLGLLVLASGTSLAPFIYTLF